MAVPDVALDLSLQSFISGQSPTGASPRRSTQSDPRRDPGAHSASDLRPQLRSECRKREELRDGASRPNAARGTQHQLANDAEDDNQCDRVEYAGGRSRQENCPEPQHGIRRAMVVSIHPRRSGMAKGQRAILHSIRRPLRANARSHFRPRQPDSLEDDQRRDQFRFLLKRISRADRKMSGGKIEGGNGMFHKQPKVDNSESSPQRRGERGGDAEKNHKSLPLSLRFLRVLRASAVNNWQTVFLVLFLFAPSAVAQTIRVNPTGVNVNVSGATTVFLTFGPVRNFRPAEGTWCGELIPAAPDNGFKCDPATIFGSLPGRFDRSRSSGNLGFTDIMSIPPSVARRAYQAAQAGSISSFFYVRHFINLGGGPDQGAGGPDEYVPVTCRLSGGGARTPFALTDVKVAFDTEAAENAIVFVAPGRKPPAIRARITYNGTGRLRGRWEVVLPGEQPPEDFDLLTEAALPIEQRAQQRRYTQISRFNLFLPPTGKYTLAGPDVARLPSTLEGQYIVLLRIEATDDKEADTDLSALGVGAGVVHSGGVAGFPIPVLRYFVGSGQANDIISLRLLTPAENAAAAADRPIDFSWTQARGVALYQLEIADQSGKVILSALLQPLTLNYRAPSWLRETVLGAGLQWRVSAIDQNGAKTVETPWRRLQLTLSR